MRNIINIVARVLTIVIIALGAIYSVLVMVNAEGMKIDDKYLSAVFAISVVVLLLTIALMLVFALVNIFRSPKNAIRGLIGIVVLGVIAFIAYSLSTTQLDPEFVKNLKEDVSDSTSKLVGAGLIGTYILLGLSVLAIIYAWISKWINKLIKR